MRKEGGILSSSNGSPCGFIEPINCVGETTLKNSFSDFVKILIIGDCSVGKSSLLKRKNFVKSSNAEKYFSVVAVPKGENGMEGKREVLLEVWDLNKCYDSEKHRNYQCSPYKCVGVVLVCFDVNNVESWRNVTKWFSDIEKFSNIGTVRVIVGCKADYKASLPINMFQLFKEKKNFLMKLSLCKESMLCKPEIHRTLSAYLSISHILKLRLVCKWLYNATLNAIQQNYYIPDNSTVPESEVLLFSEKMNSRVFYTSAKKNYGIDDLFLQIITQLLQDQQV